MDKNEDLEKNLKSRKKLIKLKTPAFFIKTKPFSEPLSNERTKRIKHKKNTDRIRYKTLLEK
jgi:hypothetical protein